jgi:hypothetical protein
VKVTVAKSPAEWFTHVESKGWGIAVDTIRTTDNVARIVLRFLSKGGTEPISARHERPVWVGFFKQESVGGPWAPVLFDVAASKLQREQETTLVPPGTNEKLTDGDEAAHLRDSRRRPRAHQPEPLVAARERSEVDVAQRPVRLGRRREDLGWLDVLRMSDEPLVRAAGVLKVASLNGEVTNDELVDVIEKVKQARVQAEALLLLNKRLDASADTPTDEDKRQPSPSSAARES